MLKRILCLMFSALFLLTGCSALKENNYAGDLPEISCEAEIEEGKPQIISPSIYFINKESGKLAVEARNLVVPENMAIEEVIMSTVLSGPLSKELYIPCEGFELAKIERSGTLVNVYLEGEELGETEQFYSACCIADSIIEYCSVNYVCVFFNGTILGIGDKPCGPITKTDIDIESLYNEYEFRYPKATENAESSSGIVTLETPLYFLNNTGEYTLCEVRSISYDTSDFIKTILHELSQGPKYNYSLSRYFSREDNWFSGFETKYDYELKELIIKFKHSPFMNRGIPSDAELSALFYTIAGFIPNINQIILDVESFGMIYLTRGNTAGCLGQNIKVYPPNARFNRLNPVSITIECENAHLISRRFEALIAYYSENEILDISQEDFIYTKIDGSVCTINMRKAFYNKLLAFSDEKISSVLQSFINTIAEDSRVKTALFLSDGEKIMEFGNNLNLYYPLLPNVGLIQ